MFENPMEMYDPYYVTSNKNKQRNKMENQKYSDNYDMDDKEDDMYYQMYENYMMNKKTGAKYYNDYYKMGNDMYSSNSCMINDDMYVKNDKNMYSMNEMDSVGKKNMDSSQMDDMNMSSDKMLTYDYMSYLPENPQMAMAYVPFQNKSRMYNCENALNKGTLFEALYKPFKGRSVYRYE